MSQKNRTTAEILDSFNAKMEEAITAVVTEFEGSIIKGYKGSSYKSMRRSIADGVESLNTALDAVCAAVNCQRSIASVQLLKKLIEMNPDQVINALKLLFIEKENISIPNFPFKKEKIAEVYDFSNDAENRFNNVKDLIIQLNRKGNVSKVFEYFNEKKNTFEFTKDDDSELLEAYTVYATVEDVKEVISLSLLCAGLNNTKEDPYTFRELPEIDHRLLRKLKVDKKTDEVDVDIDSINNDGKDNSGLGIVSSLDQAMDIRILSKVAD